jgi:DNA polymerase III delta prime subunit
MEKEKKLHHANVVVGGDCRKFVFGILSEKLNFEPQANPDFLMIESQIFGIDNAREFEKWAIGKPLLGETKVSFIVVGSITHEAQNALLKVLEEPPLGTYIFINLESLGGLLPTFLSRVRILKLSKMPFDICPKKGIFDSELPAKKFLAGKIKERFALVRSLSKKENKEEMKDLIKNLETLAYKNNFNAENLKNILTAKIFASTRGSSPKMLLEWLACVL